jgi:hypothetical protein
VNEGIDRLSSINRFGVMLLSFASSWAVAQAPLWEAGKVVSVEQVSTPAKEMDPSCRAVPKGSTLPPQCRPANLRAERFWRVTVEVGNKRLVVRPYRAPKLLDSLNDASVVYVDPNLKADSSVEVATYSTQAARIRSDRGPGIPAMIESQELLSSSEVPKKAEIPAPQKAELPAPARPKPAAAVTPGAKVVLLENGDFHDLEVQEFTSQDIGDGATLYSFTGGTSQARAGSNAPVFLVLAESEAAMPASVELSRLQTGAGTRQMAYSPSKNHSASSVPTIVTQVSATVRKVSVKEPLAPGEYVVLPENSNRGFLFEVR